MKAFWFLVLSLSFSVQAQMRGWPSHSIAPQRSEQMLLPLLDSLYSLQAGLLIQYEREEELVVSLQQTLKDSATFNYDFPELTKQCYGPLRSSVEIYYADDLQLRVFTWISPPSDSLHHFATVFQVKNLLGNVVVARRKLSKEYSRYQHLFRLKDASRQLYLAIGKGKNASSFVFQTLEIFEVRDETVVDVTEEFLPGGKCTFQVLSPDAAAVRKERMPEAVFDRQNQILSCPETISNEGISESNDWTGRIIRLHFNNGKFEAINR